MNLIKGISLDLNSLHDTNLLRIILKNQLIQSNEKEKLYLTKKKKK